MTKILKEWVKKNTGKRMGEIGCHLSSLKKIVVNTGKNPENSNTVRKISGNIFFNTYEIYGHRSDAWIVLTIFS